VPLNSNAGSNFTEAGISAHGAHESGIARFMFHRILPGTSFETGSRRAWFLLLAALAAVYALLAGLHTIADADLFWQLATGRWVAQHHYVFSTDVFSYTAQGQPWIYPAGSGLILYLVYRIGGYALLSWVGAVASAGTVMLLLRRGSVVSAVIAILSLPLIAARCEPRAEMFTVVLFAAFLSILWQQHEGGGARLWILPLLMAAWVNLHLGFIAGLALIVSFVGMELLEMLLTDERRIAAVNRLRRAWPWYVASALATLANPWGWGIYSAIVRQDRAMALHSSWIAEWASVRLNWASIAIALSLRSPRGTLYWIGAIAVMAAIAAIVKRRPGPALLLLASLYLGLQHIRVDSLFAAVVVVAGGGSLQAFASSMANARWRSALATGAATAGVLLVGLRCADVVANRGNHGTTQFGTGLSWWLPQRAAEFIDRNHLLGEIFNTYDDGGYLVWRLGPARRDYVDGRAIPFGGEIFRHESELMGSPLDSELWRQEAARFHINTVLLPVLRYEGLGPTLKSFCASDGWQPIYLDEVSAVFVRRMPETEELIARSGVDCSTAPLPVGPIATAREDAYNQWANAAYSLFALGRYADALIAADHANRLAPDSFFPVGLEGSIFLAIGKRMDAEREFRQALALAPDAPASWFALASLYQEEGRLQEAIAVQRRGIDVLSTAQPEQLLRLAQFYLEARQPRAALQAFDKLERGAPPDLLAASGERSLRYQVAVGRAAAWRTLGDNRRAASLEDESVRDLVPASGQ